MHTPFSAFRQKVQASAAVRCQVCGGRVKRSKGSQSGWRCPKCGRDYNASRLPLVTDDAGKIISGIGATEFKKKLVTITRLDDEESEPQTEPPGEPT